jgi:hypothetical protein
VVDSRGKKMSQKNVQVKPKDAYETTQTHERSWISFYRLSGVLMIAVAVLWVALSRMGAVLYSSGMPTTPTAYLQLISQNQSLAYSTWVLWDVADFLLIIPTVGLYLVLRHYNKTFALIGSLLQGFFVIYDVSVTELNSMTLVSLSQGYMSAATDAVKASYLGAATYGFAALPLQTVLSFGVGTFGFVLWCLPMSRSLFRRRTAIFGAVVNAIGVIGAFAPVLPSSTLLGLFQFITLPGVALWCIVVGAQLYRHSGQFAQMDGIDHPSWPTAGIER